MKLPTVLSGLAALASAAAAAAADRRTATIYIQPIVLSSSQDSIPAPAPLATLEYDPAWKPSSRRTESDSDPDPDPAGAEQQQEIEILSYEAPELDNADSNTDTDTENDSIGTPQLVRIGVWDESQNRWVSSTTVASAENFAKGYAPVVAVTVSPITVTSSSSPSTAKNNKASGGGDIISVAIKGVAVDAGYTRDFGPRAVLVRTEPGRQVDLNRPVVLGPEGRKVEAEPEKSLLQRYWWVIGIIVLLTVTGGGGDGK